jgi:hypothetical protein
VFQRDVILPQTKRAVEICAPPFADLDCGKGTSGRIVAEDTPNQCIKPLHISAKTFGTIGVVTGFIARTELLG